MALYLAMATHSIDVRLKPFPDPPSFGMISFTVTITQPTEGKFLFTPHPLLLHSPILTNQAIFVLAQADYRYFVGLEGYLYWSLEFQIFKSGSSTPWRTSSRSNLNQRSVNLEISNLPAGEYIVHCRLDRSQFRQRDYLEKTTVFNEAKDGNSSWTDASGNKLMYFPKLWRAFENKRKAFSAATDFKLDGLSKRYLIPEQNQKIKGNSVREFDEQVKEKETETKDSQEEKVVIVAQPEEITITESNDKEKVEIIAKIEITESIEKDGKSKVEQDDTKVESKGQSESKAIENLEKDKDAKKDDSKDEEAKKEESQKVQDTNKDEGVKVEEDVKKVENPKEDGDAKEENNSKGDENVKDQDVKKDNSSIKADESKKDGESKQDGDSKKEESSKKDKDEEKKDESVKKEDASEKEDKKESEEVEKESDDQDKVRSFDMYRSRCLMALVRDSTIRF
jgi:hypothetical protein